MAKVPLRRERHELYEASVQSPEAEVIFFDRIYREWNGRKPKALREDFCGTAAVAAAWVRRRSDNTAIGVDLDRPTLEWGRRHHIAPLGPAAARVRLVRSDVRRVRASQADVVAALNFSYFVFKQRRELVRYFQSVHRSLARGGILVLDIFGGWNAQALKTEKRRKHGFTYVWQQVSFDPITHDTRFYIHFQFRDGTVMKRAFTYDWRLWTIAEVREALEDAGFRRSEVYWEGTDHRTQSGNGVFRHTRRTESCPGWIAYIVAG